MRDPKNGIMDADGSLTRQLTAEISRLSRQLEQTNALLAEMREAIRDAAIAVEELDYPTQDIFRAVGKLEKLAETSTAGTAMLRVITAAKEQQRARNAYTQHALSGDKSLAAFQKVQQAFSSAEDNLDAAVADLDADCATCTKDGDHNE
jgi:uncharacterized protein YhfF